MDATHTVTIEIHPNKCPQKPARTTGKWSTVTMGDIEQQGIFNFNFHLSVEKVCPEPWFSLMCPPRGAFPVYHWDDGFNRAHLTFLIYCVMNQKQNMLL